ncbi:MAG: hypothetical protein K8F29_02235 [Kofleriaceae bacterium]|nr:hypothetical protein [Candidatus Methylomirabilis lanthanidiphila]
MRRKGAEFLTEIWLDEYRVRKPPVLISDGFPSGWLPRPRIGTQEDRGALPLKAGRIREYRAIKDHLKARWLTLDEFTRARKAEFVLPLVQPDEATRTVSKNQISRLTNTTGDAGGGLYDLMELCLQAVDVYWRIADGYEELVRDFLIDLQKTGYGKRKSVGYGEIESFAFEQFDGFVDVPEANGFVTLSRFVPAVSDPRDGFWATAVKYGKLGEEGAVSGQPFKRPLVQLVLGSCFYDAPVRGWYGRLVTDVSVDSDVVQYGYAFPVPLRLPERTKGID